MKNVLVVDDSSTILMLIKQEFEKYDFINATYAKSYKEAMKVVRLNRDFHAAILDLNLPDAPDGQVVGITNAHHIPAVVLTANLDKSLSETILKKEVVDFVVKDGYPSIQSAVKSIIRIVNNYDTNVLVVDDSHLYRTKIADSLKSIHINVIEAQDGQEALDIMNSRDDIPLVITDYEMPRLNGMDLVLKLREKYQKNKLGIIALSSAEVEELTYKFLKLGANDFMHKPFSHNEIVTRVNGILELLDLFKQVTDLANKDFLTGAYNRRYFYHSADIIYQKVKRKGLKVAVAMIDIDKFKNINDTHGHDVGDVAIKEIKKICDENLRESDLMARFGGEEFCVFLEDINLSDTQKLFEKLRTAFEGNTMQINDIEISYTVSIGVFYGLLESVEDMVNASDKALYDAKTTGRNKVVILEG